MVGPALCIDALYGPDPQEEMTAAAAAPHTKGTSPLGRQIAASMAGTAVSVVTLNPVVVMKVMLQRKDALAGTSLVGAFRSVLRTGGVSGFWAGTSTGLLQAVPSSVLYMTAYEHLKAELTAHGVVNGTLAPGLAGAVARFYSVSVIAPLELIRTLQTAGQPGSVWELARDVVQRDGVRGLYRGWHSTVLRDVPFSAVYWFTFERLKSMYRGVFGVDLVLVAHSDGGEGETSPPAVSSSGGTAPTGSRQHHCPQPAAANSTFWPICQMNVDQNTLTFISGASSGVLAAIITHPFDVLKTQQQLAKAAAAAAAAVASSAAPVGIPWTPAAAVTTTTASAGSPRLVPLLQQAARTLLRGAHPAATPLSLAAPPLWVTLQELHRAEGLRGLYRGLSMRLLTVIPSSAIMVTVYEYLKRM